MRFEPLANKVYDPTIPLFEDQVFADLNTVLVPLHKYCNMKGLCSLEALMKAPPGVTKPLKKVNYMPHILHYLMWRKS